MEGSILPKHQSIPPSLRPVIRAYALGYLTSTGPRLFGFLRVLTRRSIPLSAKINILYTILKTSTEPTRFPTACALVVGGATTLPRLIRTILQWLLQQFSPKHVFLLGPKFINRLRFITTFLSAYFAFNLLNRDRSWSRKRALSMSLNDPNQQHIPKSSSRFAGKTIDLTLFAFTRALDALTVHLWLSSKSSPRHLSKTNPKLTSFLTRLADPMIFSLSSATIMHAWFYSPERLPKSYVAWISSAAQIDPSIIEALRRTRRSEFIYGIDTGQADLLAPLCRKLGLPVSYADPKESIPIPCELYHCGAGPSCEYHALSRFVRSFIFAVELYFPINFLSRLTNPSSLTNKSTLRSILRSSTRSSSFLATFITLFYYAVCLARKRLGPNLIPLSIVTHQMWDSGLCVLAGCLACGWSVLIETKNKRQELAFFVAPRALGTILPRVYERSLIGRERLVFAGSVATVLSLVQMEGGRGKGSVRGVFGRLLGGVMRE